MPFIKEAGRSLWTFLISHWFIHSAGMDVPSGSHMSAAGLGAPLFMCGKGRDGKGRDKKGKEGKGREKKGREGKKREGKEREGKGKRKGKELALIGMAQ